MTRVGSRRVGPGNAYTHHEVHAEGPNGGYRYARLTVGLMLNVTGQTHEGKFSAG